MTIKFIAIIVILLLQISPSISFADEKADSLLKAKARRDSILFEKVGRDSVKLKQLIVRIESVNQPQNNKYYTNDFREQMRYYEIRNNLLKSIIMQKIFYLFEYGDSTLKKKENFQAYFSEIINMGDTLKLSEYELDTCLKVRNSLVYNYRIANYYQMFEKYNWKSTIFDNGRIRRLNPYVVSDGIDAKGIIAIDTSEANLNNIVFISGNTTINNNYFDYCQCEPDSNTFVDYLYYKYHAFNDRYDNIHKVGKVTYKINSSFPYSFFSDDCDEIYFKYVKFVLKDNKWVDELLYYLEEIE